MKNKKGSVLVFALIVLSFILLASFSLASISLIERRSSDASVNSATAFQNSDKGMEEFLQQLYKDLDQNNTLIDMASSIDYIYGSTNQYECVGGNTSAIGGATPITIGNENTDFIISAYTETTSSSVQGVGGWNSLEAITDCNTVLADVARFKVIGNHNNAVRAVFLKLKDSLARGLVAHWSFEDRAYVARVAPNSADRVSYIAQDYSKQNHTLTLCELRTESGETKVEIQVIDGSNTTDKDIVEFGSCKATEDITAGMSPKRGYGDTNDDEYEATGSWVEGIVKEILSTTSAYGDDSNSEALKFDGTDYLALFKMSGICNSNIINCVNSSDDELFTREGITISLWIKTSDADSVLISRKKNTNKGYEMRLSDGKVCLDIDTKSQCSSSTVNDDEWHHIVGEWRKDGGGELKVFVDGKNVSGGTVTYSSVMNNMSKTLFIGGEDHDEDDTITGLFTGTIDDVRIWNRSLTQKEICRLCTTSVTDSNFSCDATSCP